MLLPINEIFETLQSEATFTGTPSVFVRLQGCAIGCPFCDTKHTWEVDEGYRVPIAQMLEKTADSPTFAEASIEELTEIVGALESSHVVLTGGEPCDYDLERLTTELLRIGRTVQVETSGTKPARVHPETWVTCSPKIGMPGGFVVRFDVLQRANEIKMPVGKMRDIEVLSGLLGEVDAKIPVFLQPLSTSEKATILCMTEARKRGWRVSLQMHKFHGLR